MASQSASRALTISALLACAGWGGYSVAITGIRSGMFAAIEASIGRADPYIPGGPAPYRTHFTGIAGLDRHLLTLVSFFTFIIDGPQTWSTTLAFWYLWAHLCAGWCLIALEGRRLGNSGLAVRWTTAVGIIFQNITYTVTVPLYLVLHILTSPITAASSLPADIVASNIAVDPFDSAALPLCNVLAYVVPGIMMLLPSPGLVHPLAHYAWNSGWQVFPATQSLFHRLLRLTLLPSRNTSTILRQKTTPDSTYLYVLFVSLLSQMALIAVAVTPARAVPNALAPVFADVSLASAFVPSWPSNSPVIDTTAATIAPHGLAEAVKLFLQWDVYCGGTAVLVWAIFVRGQTQAKLSIASVLPKVAFWTACGGPPAAAAILLWERDREAAAGEPRKKIL
ncbi:hypothetical protein CMQ_7226 [Grosmannia clavigera kw1407]|uniref:AtmA protein n=1 Tax=Grosmannia clavigera (strain kw1407 / UAMH 11150) TaxID=655863 RepID=F0XQD3_GROCL|nr:uncharacterized protein CMQ_7226 [Grosmannia clavigera kw1407]EFX00224.1 hypothetical protein CMQ_7226 [Grosmannia clavigera kw1407]